MYRLNCVNDFVQISGRLVGLMIIQHVQWKVVDLSKSLVTSHRKEVEDTDFTRVCSVEVIGNRDQSSLTALVCSVQ